MSDLSTRPIRYDGSGRADPVDAATAVRIITECDIAAIGEKDSGDADIAHLLAIPTMDRASSCLVLETTRRSPSTTTSRRATTTSGGRSSP